MSLFASTWAVNGALWLLLAFSLTSWTLVLFKGIHFWRLKVADHHFEQAFWGSSDLQATTMLQHEPSAKWRLAQSGYAAIGSSTSTVTSLEHAWDRQDRLERSLRRQIQTERRALEGGLAVLASIGSTAPFVGLFGTVFGIMHALTTIAKTGSASLDVVAGPIGETLISTGIGIAVALPAVLAYNFFLRRLKLSCAQLDEFAIDFINLAQKQDFRLDYTPCSRQQKVLPATAHAVMQGVQ